VRFDAAAAGTYSGQVSFATNDADENPFNFAVSGTVTAVRILDNGDSGFSTTGEWTPHPDQGYQNDIHYSAAGSGADVATWTFAVSPGRYRVSATWNPHPNRATDSPFTVLDGAVALGTVRVNQEPAPDDFQAHGAWWEDLGTFSLSGSSLVVRLTDAANEYVIADAIRIERLSGPTALTHAAPQPDGLSSQLESKGLLPLSETDFSPGPIRTALPGSLAAWPDLRGAADAAIGPGPAAGKAVKTVANGGSLGGLNLTALDLVFSTNDLWFRRKRR
jgi:hypothetical protein